MLTEEVVNFLNKQSFIILTTIDKNGTLHNSCKGIVSIKDGIAYLLDLYRGRTYENLKHNANISLTAVDEHKFKGYSLKGTAKILEKDKLSANLIKAWDNQITTRISKRIIKNVRGEKGHPRHPEALLPHPTYLIAVKTDEIVDLSPRHLQ